MATDSSRGSVGRRQKKNETESMMQESHSYEIHVFRGETQLQDMRNVIQRLAHFQGFSYREWFWNQVTYEKEFLDMLCLAAKTRDDETFVAYLSSYLQKINREDDRINAHLNQHRGFFYRFLFGADPSKNEAVHRRSHRHSLQRNLKLRKHIDFLLLSDKMCNCLKRLAVSGDEKCLRTVMTTAWPLHYRRAPGHCMCSYDSKIFCVKCYDASLKFARWTQGYLSVSNTKSDIGKHIADALFNMLCSKKHDILGKESNDKRPSLMLNPPIWITITELINYLKPTDQHDTLTRLNWLLIEETENRELVVVQKDWFRGILQCIPVEYGEDKIYGEIYNLSFNILSQLLSHLMKTRQSFKESLGKALEYLRTTQMSGDTGKNMRKTEFAPESVVADGLLNAQSVSKKSGDHHSQNMARTLLMSLLTRCGKMNTKIDQNYTGIVWQNIYEVLLQVKEFTFCSRQWAEMRYKMDIQTRASRGRDNLTFMRSLSSRNPSIQPSAVVRPSIFASKKRTFVKKSTFVKPRVGRSSAGFYSLSLSAASSIFSKEKQQSLTFQNLTAKKKLDLTDAGLHLSNEFELLDHQLILKAIDIKSKLLISFDYALQPNLTKKEKQFLKKWEEVYTLFCDCEKVMAEIVYRQKRNEPFRTKFGTPKDTKLNDKAWRFFTLMGHAKYQFNSDDINYVFYMLLSTSVKNRMKIMERLLPH